MVCVSIQFYVAFIEQWTLKLCKNIFVVCLKSHSIVVFFIIIIYVLLCRSIWMHHKQSYGDVDLFAQWIVNVSSHFTWIIVMSLYVIRKLWNVTILNIFKFIKSYDRDLL